MAFNKTGVLLEGIRLANANNPFNFPPRNLVTNTAAFNAVSSRAEYSILADTDNGLKSTDIGDSHLLFRWTKNEGSVLRFTYDGYAQKWFPSPGSTPDSLGVLANNPRLRSTIPDLSVVDAPFTIYVGETDRVVTFTVIPVGTEADFTNPPSGSVQIALDSGLLNFNSTDIVIYQNQSVFSQRQSFFDRTRFKGQIGELPSSSLSSYFIHLNPLPFSGQIPRVRIDYQRYLTPIQVANESGLVNINSGTFKWAANTGRIKFADTDVDQNAGRTIYYDGVYNGSFQLTRASLGSLSSGFPSIGFTNASFIGTTDSQRFVLFAELVDVRSYFTVNLVTNDDFPSQSPLPGECYINSDNGRVYFNPSDVSKFSSWTFISVDTVALVDDGVSVQFYRSSVNTSGESVQPDFTVFYLTEDQIMVDGLSQSPFIILPTVPTVDQDLSYSISRGPSSSGTFTGELNDSDDPDDLGIGYKLNLDQKQLQFHQRKTVTKIVQVPSPIIKLDDGIINKFGLEINRNGTPITPGAEFEFDQTTGELKFLKSVGLNDPDNTLDILGVVSTPNTFVSNNTGIFDTSFIGRFGLITSGPNTGIYSIVTSVGNAIGVFPDFVSSGQDNLDVYDEAEVIADNFWEVLNPPLRKITVSIGSSISGPFNPTDKFTVLPTISQVNLLERAQPGFIYKIDYQYTKINVDGTTSINTASELSLFRVKQEQASTVIGSSTVHFNPSNRNISLDRPIEVYFNGVTQKSDEFQFIAPDTIQLKQAVQAGQIVTLNYWVNNALGGETSFQLQNSFLDVDIIQISNGQTSIELNGNYLDKIFIGSILLADKLGEVIDVTNVLYSPVSDTTTVSFDPAQFNTGTNEIFRYSTSTISDDFESDGISPSLILRGSSQIKFSGNNPDYREGTIISIDDDFYRVISSLFDSQSNSTIVTLAVTLKRNYINPVILRSKLPIFFPTNQFITKNQIDINQEFILVLMGDDRKILTRGVDYTVSGNSITTSFVVSGLDSLTALYVAESVQPAGTIFEINYSYAISPNDSNGMSGQRLLTTYNLYSPDNFFYRIETLDSFLPEVQDLLRQSSQSTGVSGPNTRDAVGRSNKDEGSASPYFAEQHLSNLDYSIIQLLKFYNDLINFYEDILSNLDGRIVGGEHGRFRFDGNLNNPPRETYSEITNDLDDKVVLYYKKVLTGFFTFESVPVYVSLSDTNSKSRIYPLQLKVSSALNNLVGPSNKGEILGTVGTESLTGSGDFISTPASAVFDSKSISGGSTTITITSNGNADELIPSFETGTEVTVYRNNGVPEISGPVTSITSNSVTITGVSTLITGSIARSISDPDDTSVHRYKTNFDIGLNRDTGEIINITNASSPDNPQTPITGDEIVDVTIQFNNSSTTPKRIPVLDGSTNNDFGFISVPVLRRDGESVLLSKEKTHLGTMGRFSITSPNLNIINSSSSYPAVVGDTVRFMTGPNSGQSRSISAVIVPNFSYQVSIPFASADPGSGSTLEKILSDGTRLNTTLNAEIGIIETNVSGILNGNLKSIDSELTSVSNIVDHIGIELSSGTGNAVNNTTFQDASANFSLDGADSQSYLYVTSGINFGLYHILSATATQLIIENTPSFPGFPAIGSGNYIVFNIESFLTANNLLFLATYLSSTFSFLNSTKSWQSSPSITGRNSRINSINSRINSINTFSTNLGNLLSRTDKLYDIRYLWIQQRTDKKTGLLVQRNQAILKRQEDLQKIVADQQKLLIVETL